MWQRQEIQEVLREVEKTVNSAWKVVISILSGELAAVYRIPPTIDHLHRHAENGFPSCDGC